MTDATVPTRYWHRLDDGRIQCDVCPRACKLREGQRGLCFVRAREGDAIVLTTYGRSSGFCVDPIEKKPLNHFLPGSSVPSFGTAFHPDYKLLDRPPTPPGTLTRARSIALANGVRYAYTGNVFDVDGQSTYCPGCGVRAIERDWYRIGAYGVDDGGRCTGCGTRLAGVFSGPPGHWGARRLPVMLSRPRGTARA